MKKMQALFGALLLVLGFIGCQRDIERKLPVVPTPPDPVIETRITTTITGHVLDEHKLPVQGATVTAGNSSTLTDVNGMFRFTNASVSKAAAFIKVTKAGYFTGSRTFAARENSTHFTEIELIPNTVAGGFHSTTSSMVRLPSGAALSFPENSIRIAGTATPYTGTVSVAAFFLNPAAENFNAVMPGDLRGINTEGNEKGLKSFGMMAVELTGSNGEKLQLDSTKKATLTFPVTAALQASAPQTIPLWYFDEEKGLWKEEGIAIKQGENYVGTVNHFSFWNVDAPFALVDFKAQLKDANNQPLANAKVIFHTTADDLSRAGYGITDSIGFISGKIPAGENLKMDVYNSCGAVIYTKDITALKENTDFGTLTTTNEMPGTVGFSGTVNDCNGNAVSNGFVTITMNGAFYRAALNNGSFAITISNCSGRSGAAYLFAYDVTTNLQSSSTAREYYLGETAPVKLVACGSKTTQYINYTLDGKTYSYIAPVDSMTCGRRDTVMHVFAFSPTDPKRYFSFDFTGTETVGHKLILAMNLALNDSATYGNKGAATVRIERYGAINDFIEGTFILDLRSSADIETHRVFGTFLLKRQY